MLKTKRTYLIPIIGFALIILIGSILLYCPLSNKGNVSFKDCFFISTSGLSTTGIVKGALSEQFTFFGQVILAILMEIGAMGFIIFVSYFWTIKHKKMRMSDIMVINDSISGDDYSNIKKHSLFIFKYMFRVQVLGIALFLIKFWPMFGFVKGTWYSVFHTISAFSNTGFDIFGANSMKFFSGDIYIQVVTILIMTLGSLGILVIEDLKDSGFKLNKLKLQTKIVLFYTLILLLLPTLFMKLFDMNITILNSLFMASSARNTGFSVVDIESLSFESKSILAVLMLIGGGPTSTSGGIRILTLAVLIATIRSTLRGKEETIIGWKKIPEVTIRRALTIVSVFVFAIIVASFVFFGFNDISMGDIVFDNISAISNTGLSLIPSNNINLIGDVVLISLMFIGRVGPLSMVMVFMNTDPKDKYVQYPSENIVL